MSDEVAARLSGDEVMALRFAAHRQLSRWAKRQLSPHQHAQRAALRRAIRVLQDDTFAAVVRIVVELRRRSRWVDGQTVTGSRVSWRSGVFEEVARA
jgi:hypothetical protein